MRKKLTAFVVLVMATVLFVPNTFASDDVASVGGTTYNTLQEAIDKASDGDTVKLLADVNESIVVSSKSITLDLGSSNITAISNKDAITVSNGATLTISGTGVVASSTKGYAAIYNNGTTIINGGTYKTVGYYVILQHGTMTINGGQINGVSGSSAIDNGYYDYGSQNERKGYVSGKGIKNPKLTINGGTLTNSFNVVKNDDGGILEVNGGTITSTEQAAIQNVNVTTINGGTINATGGDKTAIINAKLDDNVDKGELVINDGTFNSDYLFCSGTFKNGGSVEITDGEFNNSLGVILPITTAPVTVTVTGGTFATKPSSDETTIPEGYTEIKNADGTTTVSKIEEPKEEPKTDDVVPETPNTSDNSMISLGMFIISLFGMVYTVNKLKNLED